MKTLESPGPGDSKSGNEGESQAERARSFLTKMETKIGEGLKLYFSFPKEEDVIGKAKNLVIKTLMPLASGLFLKAAIRQDWKGLLGDKADQQITGAAVALALVCAFTVVAELNEQHDKNEWVKEMESGDNKDK